MTYKPLTDLELSAVVPEFGVTLHDADRLIEQARRANRLAEATAAVIRFYDSGSVSIKREMELLRAEKEALAAYRGEP